VSDQAESPIIEPTLVAIAVAVYALANVAHEGLGHGGACLLAGGEPRPRRRRTGRAGARGAGRKLSSGRYFLWLLMTVSLCQGTGYWLFSGLGGIGDWRVVADFVAPGRDAVGAGAAQ
jgi:hypothetical protein